MEVLVDTSIWSKALRRTQRKLEDDHLLQLLEELIKDSRVKMMGPVRQELLSGIPNPLQVIKLRKYLRAFDDLVIHSENYERAAEMHNLCQRKGVQGSHIDFLMCAVAEYYQLSIFTSDKDFTFFAKYVPIKLYN